MAYKFNENVSNFFEEYLTLILDFPEKQTFEIKHRRKILREWLDNEITLWEKDKKKLKKNKITEHIELEKYLENGWTKGRKMYKV